MPSEGKQGPVARGPKPGAKEGTRQIVTRPGGSTKVTPKGGK